MRRYIFHSTKRNNYMHTIRIIAGAEILALFRERTMYSITAVFLVMAAAASFIGWSTFTTAEAIYKASVIYLHTNGVSTVPDNPLRTVPSLASFDNLIIYIALIGALLAIIIGHRSIMRERRSGIMQVLFTRPISKSIFIVGKVAGLGLVLLVITSTTAFISITTSFLLPLQHLTVSDIGHLVAFFALSFLYMLLFALIGLLFAIIAKSESLALFVPICIWVGVTFVLPELATGLTPTALLNPVTLLQLPPSVGFFQVAERILFPISLAWHYTTMSGELLGSSFNQSIPVRDVFMSHLRELATLLGSIGIVGGFAIAALQRFDTRSDAVNE